MHDVRLEGPYRGAGYDAGVCPAVVAEGGGACPGGFLEDCGGVVEVFADFF